MTARNILGLVLVAVACAIAFLIGIRGLTTNEVGPVSTSTAIDSGSIDDDLLFPSDMAEDGAEDGRTRSIAVPVASTATRDVSAQKTASKKPRRMRLPLIVRVLDESDAAMSGLLVSVTIDLTVPPGWRTEEALTDTAGAAVIETADGTIADVRVSLREGDLTHGPAHVRSPLPRDEMVVRLKTRHWVELTVVDADLHPVANLDRSWVQAKGHIDQSKDRSPSSPTGAYSIEVGASPGTVSVHSTRFGIGSLEYDPSRPSTMSGRVVLEHAAVIRATVLQDSRPIGGVHVALCEPEATGCGRFDQLLQSSAGSVVGFVAGDQVSDAEGRVEFAVNDLRPVVRYALVAEAQGVGT